MTVSNEAGWRGLRFGGVEFEVPDTLIATDEHGVEGSVMVLEGGGLRVTVDASPFADPVTGHDTRADYKVSREEIGGRAREVVSFESSAGHTVIVTRLPGLLTMTAQAVSPADAETALKIIRSIIQQ